MSNPESHGVEDYLEAIYELQEEGDRVVQARISRRLGVTPAAIRVMERSGKIRPAAVTETGVRLYALEEVERVAAERDARRAARGAR